MKDLHQVYILVSEAYPGKHCTGLTVDLERRPPRSRNTLNPTPAEPSQRSTFEDDRVPLRQPPGFDLDPWERTKPVPA
jgi:hypothetical protein